MPKPLKDLYSKELLHLVAQEFETQYSLFNKKAFIQDVLSNGWKDLELKDRMRRIAVILGRYLPSNYADAIEILLPVSKKFSGLEHMFFPEFIERFGLDHFKISMNALQHITSGSSSEFAIRPFIIQSPKKTMQQMAKWSRSKDEHVRRLASEGCRPRLPWAMALPDYKRKPKPVLNIIENLIDDKSLYVRRSVANNLNDISKDNPHLVIDIAKKHLGKSDNVDWVIKHACRGLLKQGNKTVLALFGYQDVEHIILKNFKVDKKVRLGEKFNFEFELNSKAKNLGQLRIEFMLGFMKKNNKISVKIFKISEGEYLQAKKHITKYFSFKTISTRKYYIGEHTISIVINGNKIASESFKLIG